MQAWFRTHCLEDAPARTDVAPTHGLVLCLPSDAHDQVVLTSRALANAFRASLRQVCIWIVALEDDQAAAVAAANARLEEESIPTVDAIRIFPASSFPPLPTGTLTPWSLMRGRAIVVTLVRAHETLFALLGAALTTPATEDGRSRFWYCEPGGRPHGMRAMRSSLDRRAPTRSAESAAALLLILIIRRLPPLNIDMEPSPLRVEWKMPSEGIAQLVPRVATTEAPEQLLRAWLYRRYAPASLPAGDAVAYAIWRQSSAATTDTAAPSAEDLDRAIAGGIWHWYRVLAGWTMPGACLTSKPPPDVLNLSDPARVLERQRGDWTTSLRQSLAT